MCIFHTIEIFFVLESKYPNASAAKRNAELIVKHATVYPFRLPENCMVCVFCCEDFENCAVFRSHMEQEHSAFPVKMAFSHCSEGFVKTDCSDIRCRICSEQSDTLEDIAVHLRKDHDKPIQLSEPLGLQPFKPDKLTCVLCGAKCFSLRQLSRHTQTHFLRFTCESCGKSYATNTALQVHIKYTHLMKKEQHCCRKCRKMFSSQDERRNHILETKKCWPYLCHMCGERYVSWNAKQVHLKEVHGMEDGPHTCPECGKIFTEKKACKEHFKITHTDDNYVCSFCGMKFTAKNHYDEHMVGHTKEKPYTCSVCYKSFARKKNLTQHMWIHSEYKRFECKICNKKFNQKVCLVSHNRTNHPELTQFEEQNAGVKYLLSVLKK